MYEIIRSKKYRKDFQRLAMSGRFNQRKLESVIKMIAKGEVLPFYYRNHPLHGFDVDTWECHVGSDLLLIYRKRESILVLYLIRVGSHSDLF